MPASSDGSYSYQIASGCNSGGGIITLSAVNTDNNTTLGITVFNTDTNTMEGTYQFPTGTVNAGWIFENLPNGVYLVSFNPSSQLSTFLDEDLSLICNATDPPTNTGYESGSMLELVFTDVTPNVPTGIEKPNTPGSSDYIAPISNPTACPIGQ